MADPVSMREIEKRRTHLQRKIRSTIRCLEKEQMSMKVFLSFEKDIEGWLEDLEAVSWTMEEQLTAEEESKEFAELFQTSFKFKIDVRQQINNLRETREGKTPVVPSKNQQSPNVDQPLNPQSQEAAGTPEPGRSFHFNPTAHSSFVVEPFKIKLNGPRFSGKEFETNKRSFKDFLTKFENCAASIPSATMSADLSAIANGNHASIQENTKPLKASPSKSSPSKSSPSKSSPSKGSPSKKLTPEEVLLTGLKNLNIREDGPSPVSLSGKRSLSTLSSIHSHSKDITHICRAAQYLQDKRISKVVVLVGAGISTNSGIPDFRTPGSGLYDNLQQYNIPYAEAIFDINYFCTDPYPFFTLAKELYPSVKYRPNYNHYFLRLLHERGLLLRLYTQNIDGLERLAGIPPSKLVESHGSFSQATCTTCRKKYKGDEIKAAIFKDEIPICHNCQGTVKPDIVFFGEDLPKSFYEYRKYMNQADLVLIMGTSLEVHPFAGIIDSVRPDIPRILFNMQPVGPFKRQKRTMDFTVKGDLTKNLESLVTQLGWQKEILKLLQESEGQEYAEQFHQDLKTSAPLVDGGANGTPTALSGVKKETDNTPSKSADPLKAEKSNPETNTKTQP